MDRRRPGGAGDPWGELRAAAAALELALPQDFEAQARTYLEVLARWERIGRLTGYTTPPLRVRHLLIESLMLLRAIPDPGAPLLDIGSGPGVPGLIVKLARPRWDVTLLEASRRRVNFLRDVCRHLALTGIDVCEGRAERLAMGALAGQFATVTMRAVAGIDEARVLARPFLRSDGVLVYVLGSATPPGDADVLEVGIGRPEELLWRRRFLIIRRTELEGDVSRGTRRTTGAQHCGREPKGRRRQDDDGR